MSEDVTLYEAGLRGNNGKFYSYIQSRSEFEVDNYIEIMKTTKVGDTEVVKYKHLYRSISTTPISVPQK